MIKYIKGFDGIRAVSILMVLITHLGVLSLLPNTTWYEYRFSALVSGTTGVTIFFTISGFLITQILLNEYNLKGKINLKNFFLKRILRLLPPYLLLLTTIFILIQFNYLEKNYGSLVFSFFYLMNFAPDKYYMVELGHTWSLAVEEQFYLIWPFVIQLFKKGQIFIFTTSIILVSIIAVCFFEPFVLEFRSTSFSFSNPSRWLIPAIAPIAIGCSSAAILIYKNDKINTLLNNSYIAFIISTLFFMSPLFLPINLFKFYSIIQSFGVSIFLIWIVLNQNAKITNILELKPLRYIGKISYGLYVYQGLFLTTGPTNKLLIQTFPLNIILTLFTAIVSYHFVENKFAEIKKRYFYN
jgi:peptidoglycan/LPS O-acetylase OafA/YrhL